MISRVAEGHPHCGSAHLRRDPCRRSVRPPMRSAKACCGRARLRRSPRPLPAQARSAVRRVAARSRRSCRRSAWQRASDPSCGHRGAARADRGARPPARPDPARRRGRLPRLRRRRLDLPLARARGARLSRLGAPREPRAARGGVRGRRALLRRAAGRRGRRGAPAGPRHRGRAARPPLRGDAGRLRATGHTASDQVETILYRLATSGTTTGIRVRRDDGVVRPLLTVWREETGGVLPRRGPRVPRRLLQPGHRARAHPRRDPARSCGGSTRPPSGTSSPRSRSGERLPRPVERALLELLASREGSKRLDLGDGRVAVREYESVWLERGPVPLEGRCAGAAGRSSPRARASTSAAGAPATGSPGHGQEDPGRLRRREGAALRARGLAARRPRRRGRRRPGIAEAPGYEGAVTGERA